ncbi:MAG: penicillin acylase family protein [Chloroflexi bacterium]|nr:penicillin acylase family protein [Chloroflexota bacterium]
MPRTSGTLHIDGLHEPVEILHDHWGIPHIYAGNLPDLLFSQGFVHAQDRLFQMDFNRRLVAGRLAEVMGPVAAPVDRWIRTLGLRRAADQEPGLLDQDMQSLLEAYVAGINAYISRRRFPIEFTILGYQPEKWTVVDSLSWPKLMSWGLSENWETEILRQQLIEHLGPELESDLEVEENPPGPYILGLEGDDFTSIKFDDRARRLMGPTTRDGVGSNSWAVTGFRTEGGKPLLANDMHLGLDTPAIWYENHLSGGGLNVTGVSFPGIPLVIVGHNEQVAWGFTAGLADIQDLYIEHIRREADGKVQVEYAGGWYNAEVRKEEIRVKGEESITEEVIITRHGPIINNLVTDYKNHQSLAMRWTSHQPGKTFLALLGVNRAASCQELREALREWAEPVVNCVFADTQGNIAYILSGRIPVRARGDGRIPVPGWTDEYEWTGTIPFDELPQLFNPLEAKIVTANNHIADRSYPYVLGQDYVLADRAQRIHELIDQRDRVDLATMQQMQFDQISVSAREIAPYLGRLEVEDEDLKQVVGFLSAWDGHIDTSSPAATVFEYFMHRVIPFTLENKLSELTPGYAGQGPNSTLAPGNMIGFRSWEWFQKILAVPNSPWFDQGNGETRDDVLRKALRQTVDELIKRFGPDPKEWRWGKAHLITFGHILGQAKPLKAFFDRGPYPVGGDGTTVFAVSAFPPEENGKTKIGPPFRFLADLSDLDHTLGLLAPGQSGNPASLHYDDQLLGWFNGGYHTMLFARADVEHQIEARLNLLPGQGRLAQPAQS